jgi:hypothetical protein
MGDYLEFITRGTECTKKKAVCARKCRSSRLTRVCV